MASHTFDRLGQIIDEIINSYDRLRKWETDGCKLDEFEKELIHVRDIAGEIPSMHAMLFKENPSQPQLLKDFINTFRASFLSALKTHILMLAMQEKDPDKKWIKTQVSLAIGYMNIDGTIDSFRAIRTWMK